jgi:hypothetical protein
VSEIRDACYIDGVRLPIGRARSDGLFAETRADDMAVRTVRALLERNPGLDPVSIGRRDLCGHRPGRRSGTHSGPPRGGASWVAEGRTGLGKSAVACRDAPAFMVNRLLTRLLAPCLEAATAGTSFEDIDRAIERLGMPMGPFKLIGLVGPKVALHTGETLHTAFPERFGSDPNLARLANSEFPGVYGFDGRINEEARGLWQTRGEPALSDEEIQRRALSAAADEAKRMLDAEVVADARDIDTCMILGAGWPFFMGGLCMYLDQTGMSGELFGDRLVGAKDRAG